MIRLLSLIWASFHTCLLAGQNLQVGFGSPMGISELSYGKTKLISAKEGLGRGIMAETVKRVRKGGQQIFEWSHLQSQTWDEKNKELTVSYNWGIITIKYAQVKDTLNAMISLINISSTDTLCGVSFCPLSLSFGKRPVNFQASFPYYTNNISTPAVISAQLADFDVIIENPERGKKVYMGLLEENGTNGALYRIWNGNIPFNGMTDFDYNVELRLPPGKKFTYTMAIKFVKSRQNLDAIAPKAMANFRLDQPSKLKWADRRPIAELFLASYGGNRKENNPRNWVIYDKNEVNIRSEIGKKVFRAQALKFAQNSITYLNNLNAQGVIVWDIEGQEYPHPLTYIGSPELTSRLAPEMNSVADDFFEVFRKAGFKTGICIRPDTVVFKGNWIEHLPTKNPAITLINKIRYARKRWGCTIFYVDSNLDPAGRLMDVEVFRLVHEAIPDVLLIPEHENVQYYNYTAPFTDLKVEKGLLVESSVKSANPNAFKVVTVSGGLNGSPAENIKNLNQAKDEGNIFLFRGWYPDEPTHSLIKQVWEKEKKIKKQ